MELTNAAFGLIRQHEAGPLKALCLYVQLLSTVRNVGTPTRRGHTSFCGHRYEGREAKLDVKNKANGGWS